MFGNLLQVGQLYCFGNMVLDMAFGVDCRVDDKQASMGLLVSQNVLSYSLTTALCLSCLCALVLCCACSSVILLHFYVFVSAAYF